MNKKSVLLTILMTGSLLFATGCKKDNAVETDTLNELYQIYKDGQISECRHNGALVYHAELNAFDAGGVVYDREGNKIGTCNVAWGPYDEICEELEDCETIYRVENNIWGQPALDRYGLGD